MNKTLKSILINTGLMNMYNFEECDPVNHNPQLEAFFFKKADNGFCEQTCRDLLVSYLFFNLTVHPTIPAKDFNLYYSFATKEKMLNSCNFIANFDRLIDKESKITIKASSKKSESWWNGQFVLDDWWLKDRMVLSLLSALIRSGINYNEEPCIEYLSNHQNTWLRRYFEAKSLANVKYLITNKKYTFTAKVLDAIKAQCTEGWCQASHRYGTDIFE